MQKYNMPLCEKETHIHFNAESKITSVETFDPTYIRKLDKLVGECPECYRLVSKEDYLGNTRARYEITDKKLLSFRKPVERTMTDEQRKAASERMRKLRNKGA